MIRSLGLGNSRRWKLDLEEKESVPLFLLRFLIPLFLLLSFSSENVSGASC